MYNSAVWQLGAMVVQEAVAATLLVFAGYAVVVLLLRTLEAASRQSKKAIRLDRPAEMLADSSAALQKQVPIPMP